MVYICQSQSPSSSPLPSLPPTVYTHLFSVSASLFLPSDQLSRSVVSDSLWPHELQHARPPCPSPAPGVHPDSRPSSQWCHPAISSSVVPFSSCPQSLPASVFSNEWVYLYHFSRFHNICNICVSLFDLLHSVWQSLSPFTSLPMTQLHSSLWLSNSPLYICAKSLPMCLSVDA